MWGTLTYIDGFTGEYAIYECLEISNRFLHEVFVGKNSGHLEVAKGKLLLSMDYLGVISGEVGVIFVQWVIIEGN